MGTTTSYVSQWTGLDKIDLAFLCLGFMLLLAFAFSTKPFFRRPREFVLGLIPFGASDAARTEMRQLQPVPAQEPAPWGVCGKDGLPDCPHCGFGRWAQRTEGGQDTGTVLCLSCGEALTYVPGRPYETCGHSPDFRYRFEAEGRTVRNRLEEEPVAPAPVSPEPRRRGRLIDL